MGWLLFAFVCFAFSAWQFVKLALFVAWCAVRLLTWPLLALARLLGWMPRRDAAFSRY